MDNNVQATEQTAPQTDQPSQPSMINLPPEQLATIREGLMLKLQEAYSNFIKVVQGLPIHLHCKQQGLIFTDTGLCWIEKGLSLIQIAMQAPTDQPTPPPANDPAPQETNQAA